MSCMSAYTNASAELGSTSADIDRSLTRNEVPRRGLSQTVTI